MRKFVSSSGVASIQRVAEHGGSGPIAFRRLIDSGEFDTNVDFLDLTVIPPGSTIGLHEHHGNEELYFIVDGDPLVRVDGAERRLHRTDVAIVRSGGSHELINDSSRDVEIFVVQVRK
ncbi:MAG TPA: cupin domain-containing protein [Candidatus Eremiobacteraceae bacterium]|jgi:mannose-6-phosphate isomerase-like protein (cupin superfamily)